MRIKTRRCDTGEVYSSLRQAARSIHVSHNWFTKLWKRNQGVVYGIKFALLDEEDSDFGGELTANSLLDIPPNLDTPEFRRLWEEWRRDRSALGNRISPKTARYQLNRLSDLGLDRALAALKYSLERGYRMIKEEHRD